MCKLVEYRYFYLLEDFVLPLHRVFKTSLTFFHCVWDTNKLINLSYIHLSYYQRISTSVGIPTTLILKNVTSSFRRRY